MKYSGKMTCLVYDFALWLPDCVSNNFSVMNCLEEWMVRQLGYLTSVDCQGKITTILHESCGIQYNWNTCIWIGWQEMLKACLIMIEPSLSRVPFFWKKQNMSYDFLHQRAICAYDWISTTFAFWHNYARAELACVLCRASNFEH